MGSAAVRAREVLSRVEELRQSVRDLRDFLDDASLVVPLHVDPLLDGLDAALASFAADVVRAGSSL